MFCLVFAGPAIISELQGSKTRCFYDFLTVQNLLALSYFLEPSRHFGCADLQKLEVFLRFLLALDPRLWGVLHFSSGKPKKLEVFCFASEVLAGFFMVSGRQL